MLEPSASRFWLASLQSGLTDAPSLRPCWDAIPPEKRVVEHIDRRLARQAVQSGVLTLWQAQQLIAGKSTGFKIDRYVLLDLIGQGGMGRVYLARDSRLNRRVAVKILTTERVNNPRAIARFHREGLVGAQLQHENLVRIYDEGESNGRCYLVMEYIAGKNIGQIMAEGGPISFPVAARLTRHVALGLEHARLKGLIHRDVNPYNILVTVDGVAKLTDMGLAIDLAVSDRVTRDGATVGTFDYVSPEQARHSHSVDARSDIYSLGCTIYHMLAGHVPYPTVSLPEKLYGHQVIDPEPLSKLCPAVPSGLSDIVAKMMRKSPNDRFQTPLELAQALEPFCDDSPGFNLHVTPPVRTEASAAAMAPDVTRTRLPGADRVGSGTVTPATPEADGPAIGIGYEPALEPESVPVPVPIPVAVAVSVSAPVAAAEPVAVKTKPAARPVDLAALGLNLAVDLGPELSLTESLGNARSRSRSKPKTKENTAPSLSASGMFDDPFRGISSSAETTRPVIENFSKTRKGAERVRSQPWFLPAAAGVGLLLTALAFLAYQGFNGGGGGDTADKGSTAQTTKGGEKKTGSNKKIPPKVKREFPRSRVLKGNEVEVVSAEGTVSLEPDLAHAMRAAIGARGHVLLRNTTPLKFSAADATTVSGAGGSLVIRAAEGTRPVLQVEVKGRNPFLSTRTRTALLLQGVTIEVTYLEPGPNPAPVISAGSNVTLDRCAFKVVGVVPGANALAVEGGDLTANGCWFENFKRAIDLSCYNGSSATLRQCMIVHTKTEGGADSAPLGWALKLRSMPGGPAKTGRRLKLEHCTVKGQGFLDLAEFTTTSPVTINLAFCAVLTDTLVAWESDGSTLTDALSRSSLSWAGRSNQYDIRGKSWVLIGQGKETPAVPMADGPTDLASWTKSLGDETDPVPPPVRFATDPPALSEHPEPRDFAVPDQAADSPGAAPAFVGPGAQSVPASAAKGP